jgi:hypothetical protein
MFLCTIAYIGTISPLKTTLKLVLAIFYLATIVPFSKNSKNNQESSIANLLK